MNLEFEGLIGGAVTTIAVVVAALMANYAATRGLGLMERRGGLSPQISVILRRTARWAIVGVAGLFVLQGFGVLNNAWAMLTAVLGLVAVGFVAVWSILSNILCALVLLVTRSYRVGDHIALPSENLHGDVVDFNVMFTTLRDEDGDLIQIPNNLFLQRPIKRKRGTGGAELQDQLTREGPADETA